ncbi:MAG: DUF1616 domain-containing protein [Dehalococcoidia bacterium]
MPLRKNIDLLVVAVWVLLAGVSLFLLPSIPPLRAIIGVPFLLLCPGYAVLTALFPRKHGLEPIERIVFHRGVTIDVVPPVGLETVEWVAFSLGLSIASVALLGLALTYTPCGIRLTPMVIVLTLIIVGAAVVTIYRRQLLPVDETFVIPFDLLRPRWRSTGPLNQVSAAVLLLSLLGLTAGTYVAAASPHSAQRFSEFYILGLDKSVLSLPRQVTAGETVSLIAGVVNHEGSRTSYRIALKVAGQPPVEIARLQLAEKQHWEGRLAFVVKAAGDGQRVDLLLFRGTEPVPYRRLHLVLNVQANHPSGSLMVG